MFPSIVEKEEMFVLKDIVYLVKFTGAAVLGVANDHTRAVLHLHGALAAPVALDGHELTLPHHGLGLGDAVAGVLEDASRDGQALLVDLDDVRVHAVHGEVLAAAQLLVDVQFAAPRELCAAPSAVQVLRGRAGGVPLDRLDGGGELVEPLELPHDVVQDQEVLVGQLLQGFADVVWHHVQLLGGLALLHAVEIDPHVGREVAVAFAEVLEVSGSQASQLRFAGGWTGSGGQTLLLLQLQGQGEEGGLRRLTLRIHPNPLDLDLQPRDAALGHAELTAAVQVVLDPLHQHLVDHSHALVHVVVMVHLQGPALEDQHLVHGVHITGQVELHGHGVVLEHPAKQLGDSPGTGLPHEVVQLVLGALVAEEKGLDLASLDDVQDGLLLLGEQQSLGAFSSAQPMLGGRLVCVDGAVAGGTLVQLALGKPLVVEGLCRLVVGEHKVGDRLVVEHDYDKVVLIFET